MKCIIRRIQHIQHVQKEYFRQYSREIAMRNLQSMQTAAVGVTSVYALYFVITALFFKSWTISPLYALILPALALFALYARQTLRKEPLPARQALRVTLLLYAVLMLYIIAMSVFPHRDVPAVYYPLFLLMAPILFILPSYQHLLMILASLLLFFPLVLMYKSPACWPHELFEATTAAFFSLIVIVFMTQFRLQSDSLKNKYYLLSQQDALTGTLNKAAGTAAIHAFIAEMRPDTRAALLLVDIDDFKRQNDSHGHLEGDRLLRYVGTVLLALCRKDDLVARFGGDEFVVLLKNIDTAEAAVQRAQNILTAVARHDDERKQPAACSIGICFFSRAEAREEDPLVRADAALYRAKRDGKNRFSF